MNARTSLQQQSKRQRERVYLCHFLAITGLQPDRIISGKDDGREPDFTLCYRHNQQKIGVELTTLPRLRDQMGDKGLIAKRWYWQSLYHLAGSAPSTANPSLFVPALPIKTAYMPMRFFASRSRQTIPITQADIDAVMQKKADKYQAYQQRRALNALWLLIHTDKFQSHTVLSLPKQPLTHLSDYQRVFVTRYPSYKLFEVTT